MHVGHARPGSQQMQRTPASLPRACSRCEGREEGRIGSVESRAVVEAVAFSMLVESVAWNFKECCAAGKSQTDAYACVT